MPPRVSTGDRDAVLRRIRWCAAVQTLVNCHCQLEENPVGDVEPMQCKNTTLYDVRCRKVLKSFRCGSASNVDREYAEVSNVFRREYEKLGSMSSVTQSLFTLIREERKCAGN